MRRPGGRVLKTHGGDERREPDYDAARLQRRVVKVLFTGQILGGIGLGATLSLGALLAAEISGSNAWSGMAATMSTLGAALSAVPLARLARAKGRRISLSTGALVAAAGALLAITAAALSVFALLLAGILMLGVGAAVNFQSRFAATDLADDRSRARSLAVVVWSTTIGAVLGPNLFEPGEVVGAFLGLPPLTGAFTFSVAAQIGAALIFVVGLRPDPLLTALERDRVESQPVPSPAATPPPSGTADDGPVGTAGPAAPPAPSAPAAPSAPSGPSKRSGGLAVLRANPGARYAVAVVALSHATMVSVMSMTPVHLYEHGATLSIVGFTISLHIAGMYALSPIFGWLADRYGRTPVIVSGQIVLLAALAAAYLGAGNTVLVGVSLILLGLGWSASIVSGSALVAESVAVPERPAVQGVSDMSMNLAGALGGALAGPTLVALGYGGLGLAAMVLVAVVLVWTAARNRSAVPVS
ncbi:MFS transporter [Arthrobacter castelli]|uniref:MFS transporter n=1 Tax=Arthrobacter castelli TaxID=271431 RepID=UPI00040AF701|nr:MFS transporter [Arthrobacter castelli]